MPNQSGINDDELNRMIASLQGQQNSTSTAVPAKQLVVEPPAPIADAGATFATPAVNQPVVVNNSPTEPTVQPEQPVAGGDVAVDNTVIENVGTGNNNLDDIKRQAIMELRPLVDKLELSPEDKFDTLLLLIRTTDDSSLVPAAHDAAKQIIDDSRRAQALLDVIKEIDFFGRK